MSCNTAWGRADVLINLLKVFACSSRADLSRCTGNVWVLQVSCLGMFLVLSLHLDAYHRRKGMKKMSPN